MLFLIIALGVSFFIGIRVTGSDMRETADKYYFETGLSDFFLISTMGFEESSVDFLKKELGNEAFIEGGYEKDSFSFVGESECILRVFAYLGEDAQNNLSLVEGRFPQNAGEGVMDARIFSKVVSFSSSWKISSSYSYPA